MSVFDPNFIDNAKIYSLDSLDSKVILVETVTFLKLMLMKLFDELVCS